MENVVKVKPFGVFKLADTALVDIEKSVDTSTPPETSIKDYVKKAKKTEDSMFFGINPSTKEMFSFIPIIDNDKFFVSLFPDPVQLYYSLAFSNYQSSVSTRRNITLQRSESSNPVSFINSYLYNWHLQQKISTIIFLHSTVEAFLNYIMPDGFIYKQEVEGDKTKKYSKQITEYSKEQTEKWMLFKEKLNQVFSQITGIELQKNHQKIYDKILKINEIRNDLIHLRSSISGNANHFQYTFNKVINIELKPYVVAVKDFLNLVKPNFIEFEEHDNKESGVKFEFKSYSAFKLDMSIFMKILQIEQELINLEIPISDDSNFQIMLNWVMQNLDIMAKDQIIYFPKIEKTKEFITIQLRKRQTLRDI